MTFCSVSHSDKDTFKFLRLFLMSRIPHNMSKTSNFLLSPTNKGLLTEWLLGMTRNIGPFHLYSKLKFSEFSNFSSVQSTPCVHDIYIWANMCRCMYLRGGWISLVPGVCWVGGSMSVGWGLAGGGFVDGRYPIEGLVCQGWVCQSGQVSWGGVGIPGGGWVFQGWGGYASWDRYTQWPFLLWLCLCITDVRPVSVLPTRVRSHLSHSFNSEDSSQNSSVPTVSTRIVFILVRLYSMGTRAHVYRLETVHHCHTLTSVQNRSKLN